MISIVSPISRVEEVKLVISAGAKELYCGVLTKEERTRYTTVGSLNRYPAIPANLNGFSELEEVIKIAHSNNALVSFVLNEFYSQNQYSSVLEQAEEAKKRGVDALIIQDIGILAVLKNIDL